MDEAEQREFLEKLDPEYMRRELARQNSYTFVLELRQDGEKRVKRFQVFYIGEELGRVCMTRADVTTIVRQEQQQKGGPGCRPCRGRAGQRRENGLSLPHEP